MAVLSLVSPGLQAGQPNRVADPIVLDNDYIRYVLQSKGRILGFVDKQTGKDYFAASGQRAVMVLKLGTTSYLPSACRYADGKLTVQFEEAHVTVVAKVTCKTTTWFSKSSRSAIHRSLSWICRTWRSRRVSMWGKCRASLRTIILRSACGH